MKRTITLIAAAFAFTISVNLASVRTVISADGARKFVGAGKCKLCHSTEKIGNQFQIWQSSKHAQAYADLATDTAKAVAKSRGIDDPQKSPKCLKCHETGYGEPASSFEASFDPTQGVQCESCHGAGSDYWKLSTMKGVHAKTIDAATVGLVVSPTEEACVKCHNEESPFYRGFDFKADSAKIAHPMKE